MPIVLNPASEYAKELRKWEQHHTQLSLDENGESKPGNPYVFRPYPKMLYKAQLVNGKVRCVEGPPLPSAFLDDKQYDRAVLTGEAFNRSCQRIVGDEAEEQRAKADGWRDTIANAVKHLEALEQDIANAAAEAAFHAQRMTEQARAELAAADAATHQHVTDVTGPKRGKAKGVVARDDEE